MSGLIGISPPKPPKPTPGTPNAPGAQTGGDLITDGSEATFAQDVIEASMTHPVIVDFWAPWCGPCKQLTPALEKAVEAAKGAVALVKINVDENQMIAQQLRIQSIPTIYAFFQGQPVDGFQGALPESQLKSFIDKLAELGGGVPGGMDEQIEGALEQVQSLLDAGQADQAQQFLGQILGAMPDNAEALGLMARSFLVAGDQEGAQEFLNSLDPEVAQLPQLVSVKALLTFSQDAQDLPSVQSLREAHAQEPEDLQKRFDLARGLLGSGARDEAAEHLLALIKAEREWNKGAARQKLLDMFEAFGQTDAFTLATRRKLSAILFS